MTKSILVVENEPTILDWVCRALKTAKYEVASAPSRTQAALLVKSRGDQPVDLLIVDIELDGESGVEYAIELAGIYPQARILFISGFVDDLLLMDQKNLSGKSQFLRKPFGVSELLKAVAGLLR